MDLIDSTRKFDVLSVGNANIDIFLSIHDANTHCHVNEKDCEICFPYGQKVLVDSSEFFLGGGASNVSVGLSRLGFRTALVAEVGDDEFAQKIQNILDKEQVDRSNIIQTQGATSSFSVGINFKGERTLFVKHTQRAHNFLFENNIAQWVYLGGLGKEWGKAYKKTLDFVQTSNLQLAFAPGTTQIEEGVEGILPVIQRADILFVNKEEATRITNPTGTFGSQLPMTNDEGIKELLESLQKMGAKMVVITDGKNGSYVIDKDSKIYATGIHQVKVVEKTGAGDAYASGFLGALLSNLSIEEAMRWGSYNAASVVGKIGAQAGLLSKEKLEVQLKE